MLWWTSHPYISPNADNIIDTAINQSINRTPSRRVLHQFSQPTTTTTTTPLTQLSSPHHYQKPRQSTQYPTTTITTQDGEREKKRRKQERTKNAFRPKTPHPNSRDDTNPPNSIKTRHPARHRPKRHAPLAAHQSRHEFLRARDDTHVPAARDERDDHGSEDVRLCAGASETAGEEDECCCFEGCVGGCGGEG